MSSFRSLGLALLLAGSAPVMAQGGAAYSGIGRPATPAELAAWDIDVRPDFKGLPKGAGSVGKGQEVWEAKCASCHGVFGESNEVFNPLVGGTTAEDVKTGRVATLRDGTYPGRTTLMKLSSLSSLWDYINRAMPWTQPKSLSTDEVYAVTAYLLNLGGVVPDDFTLSDKTMAEAQSRLPNRNGKTTEHGMWPGRGLGQGGRPDVQGTACMKDCKPAPGVVSMLPAHARNSHGNLAEQNRWVGPQRGVDTSRSDLTGGKIAVAPVARPPAAVAADKPAAAPAGASMDLKAVAGLTQKYACTACHAPDRKVVGPSWGEVARKHGGKVDYLASKIKLGGSGVWGVVPMPPQSLSEAEARQIATWLANGAPKGGP